MIQKNSIKQSPAVFNIKVKEVDTLVPLPPVPYTFGMVASPPTPRLPPIIQKASRIPREPRIPRIPRDPRDPRFPRNMTPLEK